MKVVNYIRIILYIMYICEVHVHVCMCVCVLYYMTCTVHVYKMYHNCTFEEKEMGREQFRNFSLEMGMINLYILLHVHVHT